MDIAAIRARLQVTKLAKRQEGLDSVATLIAGIFLAKAKSTNDEKLHAEVCTTVLNQAAEDDNFFRASLLGISIASRYETVKTDLLQQQEREREAALLREEIRKNRGHRLHATHTFFPTGVPNSTAHLKPKPRER